jgi:hypothetical protein
MRYKNFDFSVMLTYGIGGKVLDVSYQGLMHAGEIGEALHVDMLNRWTADNTDTDVPVLNADQNANGTSTRFLMDASYLSFRNISIGYQLPVSLAKKAKMNDVRIFASVDNLYTFTKLKGLDPQQALSGVTDNVYTPLRTISMGLSLKF